MTTQLTTRNCCAALKNREIQALPPGRMDDDDPLKTELEAVCSVFEDKISVDSHADASKRIVVSVFPETGGVQALVFASLVCVIECSAGYPAEPAQVKLKSSMGIASGDVTMLLAQFSEKCTSCAEESEGCLFELINLAQEFVNRCVCHMGDVSHIHVEASLLMSLLCKKPQYTKR